MILSESFPVSNFAVDTTITTSFEAGTALATFATTGSVILEAVSAIEVEGYWFRLLKQTTDQYRFDNSGGMLVIKNISSEVDVYCDLHFVNGVWIATQFSGTWT